MPERKTLADIEVKQDGDQGVVSAVFSRFNVVDHDGDVTLPGAFTDGQKVRISAYNHTSWSGALPVGKGAIRTTDTEAILDGQFFLDTVHGRDTFQVVKEMGDLQEWSYGFDIDEWSAGEWDDEEVRFLRRLTVHEVSPVLLGAGIDTRTLTAKSLKDADVTQLVGVLLTHDLEEVAKAIADGDLKFCDHLTFAAATVEAATTRAADVSTMRREQGKSLGETSREAADRLKSALETLREVTTNAAGNQGRFDGDPDLWLLREPARFRL